MPQQVYDPPSEYGKSGSVLAINPTDRNNQANYSRTAAELRSPSVIRGNQTTYVGTDPDSTASTATLTTLTPSTIAAGSANATVTLTGTGFVAGMSVIWGTYGQLYPTVASATSATVTAPHSRTVAGAVTVTVKKASEVPSGSRTFTYT